jgi:hypothetical protein
MRDEAAGSDGGRDGGQAEQQRHGGRHQRAESEHEDEQRHGDRDELGAVQAVVDGLVDRVAGRSAAELAHGHAGMRGAHGGDGPLQWGDVLVGVVGVAAETDDHEGRLAAGSRDRRRDRGNARQPPNPALQGGDGGRGLGAGVGGEHDVLGGGIDQPSVMQAGLGGRRFAGARGGVGELAGAAQAAGHQAADDQRQPQEDGQLGSA